MKEKIPNSEADIDSTIDLIDEPHITENETSGKTFLAKFRSFALTLMLLMISIGQWNDTKDVVVSAYEEIISRWTNTLEYSKLEKLRIGFSTEYIEDLLGKPQVVKVSKSSDGLAFNYYSSPKYLLTAAIKDNRLSGFSILSLKADFEAPIVYFDKQLNTDLLTSYLTTQDMYMTDFGNAEYFIENYELSRNLMFYNFSLGLINNGIFDHTLINEIRDINDQLNRGEDLPLSQLSISSKITPNYYSVSEFSNEIMSESILSRFEMATIFNY